jgi:SAM-dependent methyltransferase
MQPETHNDLTLRWCIPDYGMYWSDAQGYGRLLPEPSDQALRQFYAQGDGAIKTSPVRSALYAALTRLIFQISSRTEQGKISSPALVKRLLGERPARLCSLGIDPMDMWNTVAGLGHEVVSVERTPIARGNAVNPRLTALKGSAGQLPAGLEPASFDAVAIIHSLSRERDPALAVRNAASLLKPDGHLWIDVPNFRSTGFDMMGPSWFHSDPGRHLHFFSGNSLAALVETTGLKVTEVHHFGYARQFYWTGVERNRWLSLYSKATNAADAQLRPQKPGLFTPLRLLLRTLRAGPEKRHDSVRIIARK